MTPAPEKAAPIPADVLALAEKIARQVATSGKTGRVHQIAYEPAKEAAALAILADREARPSLPDSREERIREDEPVMWRRRGKHKWFYRESPPTEQSGTGWLPLYDRARARHGGNNG